MLILPVRSIGSTTRTHERPGPAGRQTKERLCYSAPRQIGRWKARRSARVHPGRRLKSPAMIRSSVGLSSLKGLAGEMAYALVTVGTASGEMQANAPV